jgi:hypothetical protein
MKIKNKIKSQIYSYVSFNIKTCISSFMKIFKFLTLSLLLFTSCEKLEDEFTENFTISWQKSLGGSKNDYAKSIQQTKDVGYIIAEFSRSDDGDVSGNHGNADYWIVKLT